MRNDLHKSYGYTNKAISPNCGRKWPKQESDALFDMFLEDVPIEDIAECLGRGKLGVVFQLERMGMLEAPNKTVACKTVSLMRELLSKY